LIAEIPDRQAADNLDNGQVTVFLRTIRYISLRKM
jgi:hypothetical protein